MLQQNTIANNPAPFGSAIFSESQTGVELVNDIVIGSNGQSAIVCGLDRSDYHPPISFNDVYSPGAAPFGACPFDPIGRDGNISVDPKFVNPGREDFELRRESPSIDAGSNTASHLPATDFRGRARVIDGNADGVAIVDQGAFEAAPRGAEDGDDTQR